MAKKTKELKKVNKQEKTKNSDELFSFDNEIIIGVTKKEEPKKQKKNETPKKQNQKKVETKKKNTNKTKQKQTKNKIVEPKKKISNEKKKQESKNSKKHKIYILKYGILVILLLCVILCAMFSPIFNIKNIQVKGNSKITEKEITSLSQIELEQNMFKLNKSKISKQIKQNAYIGNVTIKRKLPSTILIQVEERSVEYQLEYAGSYIYVDKQGYLLEISTQKLEVPILQGASTPTSEFTVGNQLNIEDLEKLLTVTKIIELAQANDIISLITRIDMENKENFKLLLESKEKTAHLGDSSNLNTKILTIKSIIEKEEGKAGEIFVNVDLNKEYPVFRERV